MLHPVTFRLLAVAACGILLACDALALSLGRVRGAVLIGRPLDVTIPLTLEAGEDGPCATGDLFYGDTRVGRGVTVRWEPASGAQGNLRISSGVPVDEPMVTLYVKAGCASLSTRRYVMLSELPPDNEPAVAVRNTVPVPAAAPAPAPRAAAPAAARTAPPATEAPRPAQAPATSARAATEAAPPRRAARAAPARKEPARQPRARLQLEPLDLSVDRDPGLRLSPELQPPAASDPQQRQAAAALWQALQKDPEQSLQDALRLQNAERELKSLREISQQNAAALAHLRAQVDQAQNSRQTATAMIVALAVFLAGLMGWLAWRWRSEEKVARVGRWFEANSELAEPALPIVDAAAARRMSPMPPVPAPAPAAPARAAAPVASAAAVVVPPAAPRMPRPVAKPAAPAADSSAAEFQPSRGMLRTVGVEELIDVHDKADFFLSIGEHEQAIGVLEAHVHDQVETSALAWMDLLELYHRFGKRAQFEELRSAFQRRFTVQVPEFDRFDQPTPSLEHYDRALSRIVALWPSRKVLEVIEESIFRQPNLPGGEPFSLEAYRDLVLLFHIAEDMAPPDKSRDRSTAPSTTFRDTSMQPLNAAQERASELDALLIPPSSPRLGVDIDLDQAPSLPPAEPLPMLDFDVSGIESFELPKGDRKA